MSTSGRIFARRQLGIEVLEDAVVEEDEFVLLAGLEGQAAGDGVCIVVDNSGAAVRIESVRLNVVHRH